ncbi:hypothetical protein MKW94_012323 [Papaver nudicaule]|uniref:TF-B3 domain-containing protein n=1 Tax=Papaver nudicaule TaxID=74823 RepID=A0AA41V2F0_PAPNU|nr:hypothetical protein [Papaver nudicaule]
MALKSYEDIRSERIQENKKRMLQLNLTGLALNLNKSPKQSSKSQAKPKNTVQKTLSFVNEVRRSARNSNKPAPVYRENVIDYGIGKATKRSARSKTTDSAGNFPIASEEEREIATEKAEALALSLGDDFPCFAKHMLHSHVNAGFWLGLPSDFCKKYLPKRDAQVALIDEEAVAFETTYLAGKVGLSGGWVTFAKDHELINGDSCVFQLTKPTQFKVFIIRAKGASHGEESS